MAMKRNAVVTLTMGDDSYEAEGETPFDALCALPVDYTQVKIKGNIELQYKGKKSSKHFFVRPLRRIVTGQLRKVQVAKDLTYLLE